MLCFVIRTVNMGVCVCICDGSRKMISVTSVILQVKAPQGSIPRPAAWTAKA